MIYYIVLLLFLLIIGLLGYFSTYLLFKSGGSILYQNVAYFGLVGLGISLLSLTGYSIYMFEIIEIKFNINFYLHLLLVLFTYILFKVWEIRHNQFVNQNYKVFIIFLSLINIGLIFNEKYAYTLIINENITHILPLLLNIFLLGIINVLFLNFNKLSMKSDFRTFPLTILILILIRISLTFINFSLLNPIFYYLFVIAQSGCFLLMVLMCINDFKKSFYY